MTLFVDRSYSSASKRMCVPDLAVIKADTVLMIMELGLSWVKTLDLI